MSLSLDKVQRRQATRPKKAKAKPKVKPEVAPARSRPWAATTTPVARKIKLSSSLGQLHSLTEQLASEGQHRLGRLKSKLSKTRTLKLKGISVEVGTKIRVHLPALQKKK